MQVSMHAWRRHRGRWWECVSSYELSGGYCFLWVSFHSLVRSKSRRSSLQFSVFQLCAVVDLCSSSQEERLRKWETSSWWPGTWPHSAVVWKRSDSHARTKTHAKNTVKVHSSVQIESDSTLSFPSLLHLLKDSYWQQLSYWERLKLFLT